MKKVFTIILLLVMTLSASAEKNHVFHHYSTKDGLFHNEIRLIRKARNGMIWLGTQNGLSSFDGYRFKVFKHKDTDPNSICSDKIYALETSANGNIWVGTTTGLCVLNSLTGKAHSFKDTFAIQSNFENDYIHTLLEDRSGYLWVSCSSGNYRYSIYQNTLEKVFEGKSVSSYYESNEGSFWVCYNGKVGKYDRNNNSIIKTYNASITRLFNDRYGVLWGVGPLGLYRFMPGKGQFELIENLQHPLRRGFSSIAEDREGNLFLGEYGGGLTIYSPSGNTHQYLAANSKLQNSISSNDIYDIFSDETGVVWLGTQEGLDVFDWSRQRFIKWKTEPTRTDGLSNSFIQSIYRDKKGRLWLGTRDKGLERLKEESSLHNPSFEHFPPSNNSGMKGTYIADMLEDSQGRIWVASWDGGLNLKVKGSSSWINFRSSSESANSIENNTVTSVIEDRKGRILVGTLGGISIITGQKDDLIFTNYRPEQNNKKSLGGDSVFKVFEDSKGRIWIGMNNDGLDLMHEELDGTVWFEHFRHHPNDLTSLSNNEVFVIFEDSKKHLWVGTSFAGFNQVIENTNNDGKTSFSFQSYTEKDGLADNEVNAILEDEFGILWISTNKGISRFNPVDKSFVNYSDYDGVLKGKFRKNAAWKDDDGTMYFGGAAGVNVFNPVHFPVNTIPPKLVVTSFAVDNIEFSWNSENNQNIILQKNDQGYSVELPKGKNRFEMQFSAMSYTSPYRNKYAWKLNGIDDQWSIYEGSNPQLSYSDLPSGKHILELKAANNDGVWNDQALKIHIKVASDNNLYWPVTIGALIIFVFAFFLYKSKLKQTDRKQNTTFGEEDKELALRLQKIMEDQQPYLDFKLGLVDLAEPLNISANQLSSLLNDVIGKSFYDYINEFRVEEVKKRLVDPKHQNKTILSIAWECGFNSKSAFNRIFKLNTSLTPSEYQKKYSKS